MTSVSLLLSDLKRCTATASVANGVLARWLARGDALPPDSPGIECAVRAVFQWPGAALPIAALTREFDVGDAAGSSWLRADPAHVRADMTTARMLACGELGLSPAECVSIARDLKPLFGDSGFEFEATLPNRWYLRASREAELPDSAWPDDAMGDDLKLHLPVGAAGRRWRVLFNETQVLLHNHPVNAARVARGAVSVNSLWFWGGGILPDWVRSTRNHVFSNAPEITALARIAGVKTQRLDMSLVREVLVRGKSDASILVDLGDLRGDALESEWLQALDEAMQRRRIDQIDLLFASGERHMIRPAHRFRVWRRVRGLGA
jgi:hypothetical protein